jgi:hypothetical protein
LKRIVELESTKKASLLKYLSTQYSTRIEMAVNKYMRGIPVVYMRATPTSV